MLKKIESICNKFCYYGITQHPSGNINPRTGEPHTICSYMAEKTKTYGIDIVMQEDTAKGHYIDYYQTDHLNLKELNH